MKTGLSSENLKNVRNLERAKNCLRRGLGKHEKLIDYEHYHFTVPELVLNILIGVILAYAIGHFFYDSLIVSAILLGFMPVFLRYRLKEYGVRRRDELRKQFRDAVCSISANQKAGYSIENSFREAWTDVAGLYGTTSIMCKELDHIRRGMDNNLVLEQMLLNLGDRSGIDDIRQFGEVFAIAKRNGGNLTEMIDITSRMIEEKTDVEMEIELMVSSRKMESNIMSLVPFMMIMYMKATSEGIFDSLYHNVAGIAIMTICLIVYIVSYLISRRLVDIRI